MMEHKEVLGVADICMTLTLVLVSSVCIYTSKLIKFYLNMCPLSCLEYTVVKLKIFPDLKNIKKKKRLKEGSQSG